MMLPPDASPPSPLASQLQDWFRTWLNRLPGQEEEQLLYELIAEGPPELVDRLTPNELQQWIRTWNKRFILSLGQEFPGERFLCAFNAVEDTIYRLDNQELAHFLQWAAEKTGLSPTALAQEAARRAQSEQNRQGGSLLAACHDPVDILAALLWAWQPGRTGLRPAMMDAELRRQLEAYIAARRQSRPASVATLLGGAAGNMVNVLHELGMRVAGYWIYHPPALAALCPPTLPRLTLDGGAVAFRPAGEGRPEDPRRHSTIFAYTPALRFPPAGTPGDGAAELRAAPPAIDRQIYRYPFFAHPDRRWRNIALVAPSGQRVSVHDPNGRLLGQDGWPFLPLFGAWQVEGETFVFRIAEDATLKQIARRFDYLLLSGLQGLGDPLLNLRGEGGEVPNEAARHFIQQALRRHLRLLAQHGVRLHLEISGLHNPSVARQVRDVIQGVVKSAGINQEELAQITGSPAFRKSAFYLKPPAAPASGDFVQRYRRALHLAQAFNLDLLYVHGNDADLILMRGFPRGAVRQALLANLFAKGIVVLALLARSQPDWREEAARMRVSLKKEGFLALLSLADAIAGDRLLVHPDERETALRQIAFSGYWFDRRPAGYSVIAAPVMWPPLPPTLSTAGAGDAVSATFTALSLL